MFIDDLGECRVKNARMAVANDITGHYGIRAVGQDPLQRSVSSGFHGMIHVIDSHRTFQFNG